MAGTLTIASSSATPGGCEAQVLSLVRQAVAHMDEAQTVAALRAGLVEMAKRGDLHSLEFPAAHRDHYSRRCVYSDPWERFSIIAMTWNVGQGTPLHDHSGVWCVEVVVDGIMEVVNYQMLDEDHFGHCRFESAKHSPHTLPRQVPLSRRSSTMFSPMWERSRRTLFTYMAVP